MDSNVRKELSEKCEAVFNTAPVGDRKLSFIEIVKKDKNTKQSFPAF